MRDFTCHNKIADSTVINEGYQLTNSRSTTVLAIQAECV